VDPLTLADLRRQVRTTEDVRNLRAWAWGLFAASLFGCLAPLMLFVDLAWVLTNRRRLAKAGPLYLALGYSALVIAGVYCVLIALFLLLSGS
jgi:hypothetical protein